MAQTYFPSSKTSPHCHGHFNSYASAATPLTHLNVPDIQIGQQVPAERAPLINSTESITSCIVDCICCNVKAQRVKSNCWRSHVFLGGMTLNTHSRELYSNLHPLLQREASSWQRGIAIRQDKSHFLKRKG